MLGKLRDSLNPLSGVPLQRAEADVTALRHQQHEGHAALAEVCDGAGPKLGQGYATAGGSEDICGASGLSNGTTILSSVASATYRAKGLGGSDCTWLSRLVRLTR